MHRIQKIFVSRKKTAAVSSGGGGGSGSKPKPKPQPQPRLERRNAVKNFDFELPSTSSASSSSSISSDEYLSSASVSASGSSLDAQRNRSLDIYSLDDKTSFRIEGKCPGEFEIICKSLGLSGPEDFCIPAAAWEEMKVRSSSSDVFPRLSRFGLAFDADDGSGDVVDPKISDPDCKVHGFSVTDVVALESECIANESSCDCAPSSKVNDALNRNFENNELLFSDYDVVSKGIGPDNSLVDRIGVTQVVSSRNVAVDSAISDLVVTDHENASDLVSSVLERSEAIGSNWVKGMKPSALAPSPGIALPAVDASCSPGDLPRSFVPEDDEVLSRLEVCEAISFEDEGGGKREEMEGGKADEDKLHYLVSRRRIGESGLPLESYLFMSTSNDDDSFRATTEPMWNSSASGRFGRIITYWEKGELLGRGSFGTVYEGIADDGFFFAIKEVSLLDQGEAGRQSIYQLEQEISLLRRFEHENIVRYYGTDKDDSKLYIFLELVTKGSLLSLYQKYNLRDSQVSAYTRQILHGLKYLHDWNVVHRDIKCANILVDASGSVKLADFGLAKATRLNDVKSCKGTALWMAPEVVNRRNKGYGVAADIWSLGCTVLEMLTRRFPYSHLEDQMQALFRIGRGELPRVPESLSRDARDFILQCLQVNPHARPTAAQLLHHPFVARSLPPSASASPHHPSLRVSPLPASSSASPYHLSLRVK